MIYHITTTHEWQTQQNSPHFEVDSLATEGFIHCSTQAQVAGVLARYYPGRMDLLLLEIDERLLTSPCRYEASTGGELFPHVYGAINKEAIITVRSIESP
jgi:uncharacterized protein (DUF952 family)